MTLKVVGLGGWLAGNSKSRAALGDRPGRRGERSATATRRISTTR
jgi:hypothetical protein